MGAVIVVAVAAAAALKAADAPSWTIVAVGIVGFAAATASFFTLPGLFTSEDRETWEGLLLRGQAIVREVAADDGFYDTLGVETEAEEALAVAGQDQRAHSVYIARDVDSRLTERLETALQSPKTELLILSGPSKAGKSRTLAEGLQRGAAERGCSLLGTSRRWSESRAKARRDGPVDAAPCCGSTIWSRGPSRAVSACSQR